MNKKLRVIDVLKASRPISWPNTVIPFAVAYYLSGVGWDFTAFLALFYFIFPYNLLVYGVNDVFDYESDILNPRKGGVEGGLLTRPQNKQLLTTTVLLNVPFIIYLLLAGGIAGGWFAFIIFAALAYSVPVLRFKERPIIDSITSSTHFFSPFVYGLLLGGSDQYYLPALVAFILWGMASHSIGAVQDIKSDVAGGLASIGTKLGARRTVYFSLICYLLAAVIPAFAYGWAGLASAAVLSLYVLNVLRFVRVKEENSESVHAGWKVFLKLNMYCGFLLTLIFISVYNPTQTAESTQQSLLLGAAFAGGLVGFIWLHSLLKT